MYTLTSLETISYVLRTLTATHLDDVGSVNGPWLEFSPIIVKEDTRTLGKIEYEPEIGWFYIPIEAYVEEETDGPS